LKVVVPAGGFTFSVNGEAESVGTNQSTLLNRSCSKAEPENPPE